MPVARFHPARKPVDDAFWRAVRMLPAQQIKVIALFYVEDASVAQIAQLLGCSPGTVKTHLFRARATLQELLAPIMEGTERGR